MKTKLVLFIGFLVAGLCTVSAQKQKVGHINTTLLMENMPERDSLENVYKKAYAKIERELQEMQLDLQQQVVAYQQNDSMSMDRRAMEESRLQEYSQKIEQYGYTQEQKLVQYQQDLYKPFQDKVKKAIKDVSKENEFTYIFDSTTLLYFDGGIDITPMVAKKLGITLPAKAATN